MRFLNKLLRDGVSGDVERVRRAKSAWFIEELGKELDLCVSFRNGSIDFSRQY